MSAFYVGAQAARPKTPNDIGAQEEFILRLWPPYRVSGFDEWSKKQARAEFARMMRLALGFRDERIL